MNKNTDRVSVVALRDWQHDAGVNLENSIVVGSCNNCNNNAAGDGA